jgi:hypothetical protein
MIPSAPVLVALSAHCEAVADAEADNGAGEVVRLVQVVVPGALDRDHEAVLLAEELEGVEVHDLAVGADGGDAAAAELGVGLAGAASRRRVLCRTPGDVDQPHDGAVTKPQ